MREHKYRAWLIQEKRMCAVREMSFAPDGNVQAVLLEGKEHFVGMSLVELMEYTGLTDRLGKDIYEGDILSMEEATAKVVFWERPPEFGLDYYHNEDLWCDDWNITDDNDRMEIIGTIYKNPNLLNGE